MKAILFVCTGNIFRSMIAEYALKKELGNDCEVTSAGTEAAPQAIVPLVLECLARHGIDPTAHRQRCITDAILKGADLKVAMGVDHQTFLARKFGAQVPLFNEVAYGLAAPVLDTNEAAPDYETKPHARDGHIRWVVDHICASMHTFIARIPQFIAK